MENRIIYTNEWLRGIFHEMCFTCHLEGYYAVTQFVIA